MTKFRVRLFLCFAVVIAFINACSSDDQDISSIGRESAEQVVGSEENGEPGTPGGDSAAAVDTNSLAGNGCQNVVIIDEFAYGACDTGIEVVDLNSLERNLVSIPADDISGDSSFGVLFTQSGNTLTQFDLVNPLEPAVITTVNTNFSIFSGISSANGILVVSAGSGGSNTEVYTYDSNDLALSITGILQVDSQTGNPDVHVAATDSGFSIRRI